MLIAGMIISGIAIAAVLVSSVRSLLAPAGEPEPGYGTVPAPPREDT